MITLLAKRSSHPLAVVTKRASAVCAIMGCAFTVSVSAQPTLSEHCLGLQASHHTAAIRDVQNELPNVVEEVRQQRLDVIERSLQNMIALLMALSDSPSLTESTRQTMAISANCMQSLLEVPILDQQAGRHDQVAVVIEQANNIEELVALLRKQAEEFEDIEELGEALRVAEEIVIDGSNDIYGEQQQVFLALEQAATSALLARRRSAAELARELAVADARGAIAGGVGGCIAGLLAGGVGCAAGALGGGVATAVGNSTLEILEKGWRYGQD